MRSKLDIKRDLRELPEAAAEAARYFADLLVESEGQVLNEQDLSQMFIVSLAKALQECPEAHAASEIELKAFAETFGKSIALLAGEMAEYVFKSKGKKKKSIATALVAGVGIALLGIG